MICILMISDTNDRLLTQEIHKLLRVVWSGKISVVTPHSLILSIRKTLPTFADESQHVFRNIPPDS